MNGINIVGLAVADMDEEFVQPEIGADVGDLARELPDLLNMPPPPVSDKRNVIVRIT